MLEGTGEKWRCRASLACRSSRPATGVGKLSISLALLPIHFWSVVAELSPLHLMDDVLGQAMIFFNLLLIAFWYGQCAAKAGVIKSHTMRLVTITVLSIIPIALMVLTATGYFYTTLRLSGRWIETVYLVIIWNLLYQTVLRGKRSGAAYRGVVRWRVGRIW
ncbi:Mechanosensitive channel MscK [Escherichia coli]|nr:Mechanosensitive channel MscK [Escherichia coli]